MILTKLLFFIISYVSYNIM